MVTEKDYIKAYLKLLSEVKKSDTKTIVRDALHAAVRLSK